MIMTGIERIANVFAAKKVAFMPYAPLGYPTLDGSLEVVRTLVKAGADLIEIGIPFSDPLADGPTVQAATQKALENGITLPQCLAMVKQLRGEGITTPFMLMGYMNPFLAYGLERLGKAALEAGVDGYIVPDLPPESAAGFEAMCVQNGQALIYMLAPTSTPERIKLIAGKAQGFIYLVSVTGVTGAREQMSESLPAFIDRVRTHTDKPLAVGFGIANGAIARDVGQYADGVIVGSALVKASGESIEAVGALAREIAEALV
jgi:tryptophan synthase alpha chain